MKKQFTDLVLRRLPSMYHTAAWKDYEYYLHLRTILYMSCKNIHFLIEIGLGVTHYSLSDRFINSNAGRQELENVEIVHKIFNIVELFYFVLVSLRVFINIMVFKWPIVSKSAIYVEMIISICVSFMPLSNIME